MKDSFDNNLLLSNCRAIEKKNDCKILNSCPEKSAYEIRDLNLMQQCAPNACFRKTMHLF